MGLAPRADLRRASAHVHQQLERLCVAERCDEIAQVPPPPVAESTVAAARPAAADVLFQQDDVEPGVAFQQEPRGPHPRVAAAEDHDVRVYVGSERRARIAGELRAGERLAEPPTATQVRRSIRHGRGTIPPRCDGALGRVASSRAAPLEDYALIGDTHTAALVGRDGRSTGSACRGSTRAPASRHCWAIPRTGVGRSRRPSRSGRVAAIGRTRWCSTPSTRPRAALCASRTS